MAGNSFGNIFKLTTFGESHGPALGGVIDGCPSGLKIDFNAIEVEMNRRKPGQSAIVTQRKEPDSVTFYSGIFDGVTTGTSIGFLIHNTDQKSKDYSHIKDTYRPSHADYVYDKKYGHRDHRGGGRSSARETACRVAAGAIAKQILSDVKITAFVSSVGDIKINKHYSELDFSEIEKNPVRCADPNTASSMEKFIKEIRKEGDSVIKMKVFKMYPELNTINDSLKKLSSYKKRYSTTAILLNNSYSTQQHSTTAIVLNNSYSTQQQL